MKKYILLTILILLIAIIPFTIYLCSKYDISLNGIKNIDINVGSDYIDEGITIKRFGKFVKNYETINKVDTSKIGTYEVIYKIKNLEEKRIVNVVDKEKPNIKLKRKYYLRNNKDDIKNIIEVNDNYDKELNIKVIGNYNLNKNGKYKIKYLVSDSSNNESELETEINVQEKDTDGIPVLMYHWFYDDTKGETAGERNTHNYIAKSEFEKQMKYLKDENYYFPTWQELIDYIDKKIDLPKKSVILTDDDCKESFFDVALPVFQKYEVPFTSFCITKRSNWGKYVGEPYLDFESHTNALHNRICKGSWDGAVMCKDYDTIYNDIKLSLEKVKNSYSFAYPFGHYNDKTIKALKENGIKLAFTINNGKVKKGANKYKLPRVRISKGTSLSTFKKLVK